MDRRHFVTAVGSGGIAALSGCLGYELTSSEELESKDDEIADLEAEISDLEEDLEQRDSEIEELESEIEQYESEVADLEAEITDLEDQIERRDGEIETLETELEDRRAELTKLVETQLSALYESGHTGYEIAEGEFERAVKVADRGEYPAAVANFAGALGHYDGVVSLTYRVVALAEERDEDAYSEVIDLATEANIYAQYMKEAANSYSLAYQHRINGDSSQAENAAAEGESAFNNAQEYRFPSVREVREVL